MYINRYKIKKEKDHFSIYDKKEQRILRLPLKVSELSQLERKNLKKTILGSKIVAFFVPGIVLLAHQLYGRWIIAVIIFSAISAASGGPNPIHILLAIGRGIYLALKLETISYENGSYYAIRSVINSRYKEQK